MPSVDLATLPRVVIPLIAAFAHVRILIIARLKELRSWSRDAISATNGIGAR
ncbi:hypothetical protein JNUCC0626_48335 [Lentzea sp. JNUCC 0626]|uniref:hypothetical protein n=1 Tax=Lentzea sp. JNUCC 0626 TaxID=3367513 RepID=UPI003747C5F9